MKIPFTLLLLACLLSAHNPSFAQTEKTLLWRISGNGMAKPSYIFGTIHLRARKLFNFPDSLYAAIDSTEIFALEINPDSMNSGITDQLSKKFAHGVQEETDDKDKQDKKLRDILTPSELKTLRENLPENSTIDPDELTVKQVYALKDVLKKTKPRKDDMPTFMDAYLYTIALDKGKTMGGLERVEDQMALLNTTDWGNVDTGKIMKFFEGGESAQDKLMELYLAKDLKQMLEISSLMPEKEEQAMLTNRNINMARRLDSIMATHSLFAAVGTLHLPGPHGLISLLRKKGYTVEPVYSSSYTNGANYKFRNAARKWVTTTSTKDGYSIEMPGTPSIVDAYEGIIKMNMYVDIATCRYFIIAHIPNASGTTGSSNTVKTAMAEKMMEGATKVETKDIVNGGLSGTEYFFLKSNYYFRLQLLNNNEDYYMLMAYASTPSIKNADSFFNSFRVISKSVSNHVRKTFDENRISASVPDYAPTHTTNYGSDSSLKQDVYTIADPGKGSFYFIITSQCAKGYNFTNDTVWINGIRSRFEQNGEVQSKDTTWQGYDATQFETPEFGGFKIKGDIVYCGSRMVMFMAQYTSSQKTLAEEDSFLASVNLLPALPRPVYLQYAPADSAFSTLAPAPFTLKAEDTDETTQTATAHTYRSQDETTGISYVVTEKKLNKYYWNPGNDTLILRHALENDITANERATSFRYYREDGHSCGEATANLKFSKQVHHIKVVLDGRTAYVLEYNCTTQLDNDPSLNKFFSSFVIHKNDRDTLQPSPAAFLSALNNTDTTIQAAAVSELYNVYFFDTDVPAILKELGSAMPEDTGTERTLSVFLLKQLAAHPDALAINELESLYHNDHIKARGQQEDVLVLLTELKDSVAAYQRLKQVLLTTPSANGYSYKLYMLLLKHLHMAATLYPALYARAADSSLGYLVCKTAERLLDSNYISLQDVQPFLPQLISSSKICREQKFDLTQLGILQLLSKFSTPEVLDEIRQYQYINNHYLKYVAVKRLCDGSRQPDPKVADTLCADKSFRLVMYYLLQTDSLMHLFPKKYLSQQYFAESYLVKRIEEDDNSAANHYKFISTKNTLYNGKSRKFYLFAVSDDDPDDKPYLGIAGPFSDNKNIVTIDEDDNATGLGQDHLDMHNLDNQVKVYFINLKINKADD